MKKLFILLVLVMLQCVTISAAELPDETAAAADQSEITESETIETEETTETETTESEEQEDVLDDKEVRKVIEYNLELAQPIETFTVTPVPVYEVNPDDYNGSTISTFAMNGSVYSGSYNSTVITLWRN